MPRNGAQTRERILDTAERLVVENGFAATSLDQVIAGSRSSKGAFFHHFASKAELAAALVERYAAADLADLARGLAAVAEEPDPVRRLVGFVRHYEDEADALMSAQSSCLYVAVLTERQLVDAGTTGPIVDAVTAWREAVARLLADALGDPGNDPMLDLAALADHVFVTFEGAFVLARATGDPGHMRRQLGALRVLLEHLVGRLRTRAGGTR